MGLAPPSLIGGLKPTLHAAFPVPKLIMFTLRHWERSGAISTVRKQEIAAATSGLATPGALWPRNDGRGFIWLSVTVFNLIAK